MVVQINKLPASKRCPICTHWKKLYFVKLNGLSFEQNGQLLQTKLASTCRTKAPVYTTIIVKIAIANISIRCLRWMCKASASNFWSISNTSNVSKSTAANEMREIPKWRARTKSDCPQMTAAAPTNPCRIRKKTERNDKNFTSRICPIRFHAKTASNTTVTPTTLDTKRWLNPLPSSGVISADIMLPLHNGQLLPQPAPESVFVTRAPPSKINTIPIVDTTPNHLIDRII